MKTLIPRVLLAALAALVLAGPAAAAGWESIESLPGSTPEIVKVKGKSRVYFRLSAQKPIAVTLAGPARLRVISRAVLAKGRETAAYQIVALEGGKALRAAHEEAGAAAHVSAPGIPALAHGRTMILDVPDGTHRVELRLAGAAEVLVRLQRAAPASSEAWVSLTPVRASRSVSVIEGEKTIAYYSVRQGQPVALRVVGPTTLDVLARLDFDATMLGSQAYRLKFIERGRTLREVEFRTTKAPAASYSNLADRVPSKFDRLSLFVGSGLHEIEVHIVSPAGGAAEIHARIPQPAVGNTE